MQDFNITPQLLQAINPPANPAFYSPIGEPIHTVTATENTLPTPQKVGRQNFNHLYQLCNVITHTKLVRNLHNHHNKNPGTNIWQILEV
jgi:hypothetical protein